MQTAESNEVGIFCWFGFILPLDKRLQMIRRAGFQATSIWWEDEEGESPVETRDMPAMVRENGLHFENIHAPCNDCNDLWSDSTRTRQKIVDRHLAWLEDCARYEIPLMVMHVTEGWDTPGPNPYGIASLERIVREAEAAGVKVAVENTKRQDEYIPLILSMIQSDYLGLCFDTSHDRLCASERASLLRSFGSRLFATHLSDNDGQDDRHWLPALGQIDWKSIADVFPRHSYSGGISLEVFPMEEDLNLPPEVFLSKAYKQASWARNLLITREGSKNASPGCIGSPSDSHSNIGGV